MVRARLEGDLQGVYVREGDRVREGQLLARFEAVEQQSTLQSANADKAAAEGDLAGGVGQRQSCEGCQADDVSLSGGRVVNLSVLRSVAVKCRLRGLDVFAVGEHHRADFAVTAPEVVLAAIAGRTSRIRLGSAVTVLSSDDPVRVYERFATL